MAGTASGRIGAALHESGAAEQLAAIELAESLGVATAWLTTGGVGPDAMGIFAAAAARTGRIGMGTAIVPVFPRHPLVLVQQTLVVAGLAPGRFRLGVGPSHKPSVEQTFGIPFERPLEYLRDYVGVLRGALQEGAVSFAGRRFTARGTVPAPPGVPVLISALRPTSYRLAGAISDGAIAWVCPLPYLRDQALPALRAGAASAGRGAPPLVAHCFVSVGEDAAAVRRAAGERLAGYARSYLYQEMFALAGFPEARQGTLSERMMDAVVVHGDEDTVRAGLQRYLDAGMDEVIASVLVAGDDRQAGLERTLRLLGTV
ncbi:MAG TPA: LLM class flavin-dependent oxidoreductase [Chloroflexota bacterium]|jgi:F420-dependent oxidoreductase-like protein|nr:LLM class flavin-dependent oxidoreductase [Chloroflexota bacterium]